MSILQSAQGIIATLPRVSSNFRTPSLLKSYKVSIIVISAGLAIAAIAKYFRRRRRISVHHLNNQLGPSWRRTRGGLRSPNGELSQTGSPGRHTLRQGSSFAGFGGSDRISVASNSSVGLNELPISGAQLTPQQMGMMGMEALETAINYFEDALAAFSTRVGGNLAVTTGEDAEFSRELQKIIDLAYNLQEESELLFLDQRSVLFRADGSSRGSREHGDSESRRSVSCAESFVSAQDEVADLREFEEFSDTFADLTALPLYQSALKQFEDVGIPCRCLRTEMVRCGSDVEYLGKLHCVRLAFRCLFNDSCTWQRFADIGRQLLTDLILFADKDPKDFLIAYEDMLTFLLEKRNWSDFEAEMSSRDVKALTFYDVVLDYILMDAFEDLESPPSSFTAVVQNRWLSNGFKETALTTAVWSVLKAKRRMLHYPTGFMSHFYAISEQMSPLMAWGFLGPDEGLREICYYFKSQVMGFLTDIFSFQKTRYTSIEAMSKDLLKHLEFRLDNIAQKLIQG